MDDFEQLTHCYECREQGYDYYYDGAGELVTACAECMFNEVWGEDKW